MERMVVHLAFIVLSYSCTCFGFEPDNVKYETSLSLEHLDYVVADENTPIQLKCHDFVKKKGNVEDFLWQFKKCGTGLHLPSCDELSFSETWQFAYCRNQTKLCTRSTLRISNPTENNSGLYQCLHKDYMTTQFQVKRIVKLDIIDPKMETMEVLQEEPDIDNQTVSENQSAVFRCRVRSVSKPHIVWARQVDYLSDKDYHDILVVDVPVKFVNGTETHQGMNKLYTSKLYINNSKVTDSGTYLCYAMNEKTHLSKKVFLMVKPSLSSPYTAYYADRDASEILWIVLSAIFSVTCCALVICLIIRTRYQTSAASGTHLIEAV